MSALALCAAGLCLYGSSFEKARLAIGGLLVHPSLAFVIIAAIAAAPRLGWFPARTARLAIAFFLLYFVSMRFGPQTIPQMLKVGAGLLMVLVSAVGIRTRRELFFVSLAIVIGVSAIAMHGGIGAASGLEGVNPLKGISNKNAFSLYALPAILLGAFLALNARDAPLWMRVAFAGGACVNSVVIFMTANRSGWVGVAVIAVMLIAARGNIKASVAALAFTLAMAFIVENFARSDVVSARWQQTIDGYQSDTLRERIMVKCVEIGLENPLLGVSHDRISAILARRVGEGENVTTFLGRVYELGPHNLFAYLIAATGFPCTLLYFATVLSLWFYESRRPLASPSILRISIVLFIVRGIFTEEIMYAPTFALAFGVAIAWTRLRAHGDAQIIPTTKPPRGIGRRRQGLAW